MNFFKRLFDKQNHNAIKFEDLFDVGLKYDLKTLVADVGKLNEFLDKKAGESELVTFLQATWVQKQMDDLLLTNQSVLESLKKRPFDANLLEKRDKIHHDINKIQPIVLETGVACAAVIEKKYGVSFCLLSGRNRPVPKKQDQEIILPGEEKKRSL